MIASGEMVAQWQRRVGKLSSLPPPYDDAGEDLSSRPIRKPRKARGAARWTLDAIDIRMFAVRESRDLAGPGSRVASTANRARSLQTIGRADR
jgi:hypothetical protein